MFKQRKRRKDLQAKLEEQVFKALCGTHYHTTNKPPWEGYIIQDADAERIRQIVTELRDGV